MKFRSIILLIVALGAITQICAGQDKGLESMLRLNRRFAAQLLAEQDYSRASDEYQKLAYHYSETDSTQSVADTLRYLSGLCQRRLGDYSRSNQLLTALGNRETGVRTEANLLTAANHYNLKAYEQSLSILLKLPISPDYTSRSLARINHLLIANYLETKQLPSAQEVGRNLSGVDSLRFAEIIDKAVAAPVKKPVLAALMSTLVPGSGKIYTGRTWDGVSAFILCIFSGWRSWDAFAEKGIKSFDGWLFGAITAYFYVGNIYGSAVSAKLYNERSQSDLRRELERIINEEN